MIFFPLLSPSYRADHGSKKFSCWLREIYCHSACLGDHWISHTSTFKSTITCNSNYVWATIRSKCFWSRIVIALIFLLIMDFFGTLNFFKLKTFPLYHEKLFIQKFNDMITHVLILFFSASNIIEAVRGRFRFYDMKVAWFKGHLVAK